MTLHLALAVAALVASAVLFFAHVARPAALIAIVASALEVAMASGVIRVHAAGVPLGLALAVTGLLCWLRATSKAAVTAAAVVALVGVLQVFVAVQGRY